MKKTDIATQPKRKPGGQPNNRSNLRHGLYGSKLPAGCHYIENRCNRLRRQVEDELLATQGNISLTDAAAINSVLQWEKHLALASHYLRLEDSNLSVAEKLKFSEAVAKASDARDKALLRLGLDSKPDESPWAIDVPSIESEEVDQ